eukprot:6867882-Alexandrium_andersonii.AAC.1
MGACPHAEITFWMLFLPEVPGRRGLVGRFDRAIRRTSRSRRDPIAFVVSGGATWPTALGQPVSYTHLTLPTIC